MFTKTLHRCPACQLELPGDVTNICPFCGTDILKPISNKKASIIAPAKLQNVPVNVDLAITIDRTGSSEQFKEGIPLTLESIFKTLIPKICKCACWMQAHSDFDYGEQENNSFFETTQEKKTG